MARARGGTVSRQPGSVRAGRGRWWRRGAVAVAVSVGLVLAWPAARANLQAICVLREAAGDKAPVGLAELASVPVVRRDLMLHVGSGATAEVVRARMYLPVGRPDAPEMVILHGVHYLGIDEPRLMSFAEAMAACGIRVLTPEMPDIKDYHVGASSIETIGESVRWLAEGAGEPGRKMRPVGVMGLSFSGGLALIAASEAEWRPYFRFVFTVGSQDSMQRVTGYYRTGTDLRPNGTVERLKPHEYGPLVLEYEYLDDLVPPEDVKTVRAVLRAHLYEDKRAEAQASLALNEVQKRETLALMDASSEETRERIAEVLGRHTAELEAVSPDETLGRMRTPVYLLHGEADNIIPAAETLWMARQVPRDELKEVLVSPVLSHLDLDGAGPGAWDEVQLVRFFAGVLEAEERG